MAAVHPELEAPTLVVSGTPALVVSGTKHIKHQLAYYKDCCI